VNVHAMLRRMTATQLQEWMEYAALEPFDETRSDYRAASVVAAIVNMNRDTKKHPKPIPIEDFLLKFGEEARPAKRKQTWQDQKALVQAFMAAWKD
jgi:hypothetical protein